MASIASWMRSRPVIIPVDLGGAGGVRRYNKPGLSSRAAKVGALGFDGGVGSFALLCRSGGKTLNGGEGQTEAAKGSMY